MQHQSAKVNNTYLHILMPQLFDPLRVPLKRHSVHLFHLYLMCLQDTSYGGQRDLIHVLKNDLVLNNFGLDFTKPDGIICQNHIHNLPLLQWCENGSPSSSLYSTLNPM